MQVCNYFTLLCIFYTFDINLTTNTMDKTILIADDNKEILIALKLLLNDEFDTIITERNPSLIPEKINKYKPDVIVLDMNFKAGINTGNEGIFWMNEIFKIDKEAVIVFITAYGEVDLAVRALKEGAYDFIQKPWDDNKLISTLINAWKHRNSRKEINSLKNQKAHLLFDGNEDDKLVLGDSASMRDVMRTIEKVAPTDASVLILGENGTGKELIAREIHKRSNRKDEVFVRVDLGSIAPTLFESELFGHEKGSFTGAINDKPGRFEIANNGSLFLDEIGNIPNELQLKLLSSIQNQEFTRLGSNISQSTNIRLISATNYPLDELVQKQHFREDLLYRINTIKIKLPPLRERLEEIPVLAKYFLEKYGKKYKKEKLNLGKEIIQRLTQYHWPGNVRELRHTIEKAVILSENNKLNPEDFFFDKPLMQKPANYSLNIEENEKELIRKALQVSRGNISKAASDLGVSRKTLYNKLNKYEIEPL
jgi:DNA-binding NtrC family response regulator